MENIWEPLVRVALFPHARQTVFPDFIQNLTHSVKTAEHISSIRIVPLLSQAHRSNSKNVFFGLGTAEMHQNLDVEFCDDFVKFEYEKVKCGKGGTHVTCGKMKRDIQKRSQ
ncbi:hypothetical protein AVEN_241128-1 [Araneus ventricosus]|uniref:Uncharacterized protein n=1 Tax=Araneus ventricosus TaxID=182803 RepID=A0A4Y2GY82_ARAVE|nr:hypothetical protein AVEN_241128-1 [Araneus ventricosus]